MDCTNTYATDEARQLLNSVRKSAFDGLAANQAGYW